MLAYISLIAIALQHINKISLGWKWKNGTMVKSPQTLEPECLNENPGTTSYEL